jgi:hypothetical protein
MNRNSNEFLSSNNEPPMNSNQIYPQNFLESLVENENENEGKMEEPAILGYNQLVSSRLLIFEKQLFDHYNPNFVTLLDRLYDEYIISFVSKFKISDPKFRKIITSDTLRAIIYCNINPYPFILSEPRINKGTRIYKYLEDYFSGIMIYFLNNHQHLLLADSTKKEKQGLMYRILISINLGLIHYTAWDPDVKRPKVDDNKVLSLFQEAILVHSLNLTSKISSSFVCNLPGCGDCITILKRRKNYFLFTECKLSEEKALEQLDLFNDVKVLNYKHTTPSTSRGATVNSKRHRNKIELDFLTKIKKVLDVVIKISIDKALDTFFETFSREHTQILARNRQNSIPEHKLQIIGHEASIAGFEAGRRYGFRAVYPEITNLKLEEEWWSDQFFKVSVSRAIKAAVNKAMKIAEKTAIDIAMKGVSIKMEGVEKGKEYQVAKEKTAATLARIQPAEIDRIKTAAISAGNKAAKNEISFVPDETVVGLARSKLNARALDLLKTLNKDIKSRYLTCFLHNFTEHGDSDVFTLALLEKSSYKSARLYSLYNIHITKIDIEFISRSIGYDLETIFKKRVSDGHLESLSLQDLEDLSRSVNDHIKGISNIFLSLRITRWYNNAFNRFVTNVDLDKFYSNLPVEKIRANLRKGYRMPNHEELEMLKKIREESAKQKSKRSKRQLGPTASAAHASAAHASAAHASAEHASAAHASAAHASAAHASAANASNINNLANLFNSSISITAKSSNQKSEFFRWANSISPEKLEEIMKTFKSNKSNKERMSSASGSASTNTNRKDSKN